MYCITNTIHRVQIYKRSLQERDLCSRFDFDIHPRRTIFVEPSPRNIGRYKSSTCIEIGSYDVVCAPGRPVAVLKHGHGQVPSPATEGSGRKS